MNVRLTERKKVIKGVEERFECTPAKIKYLSEATGADPLLFWAHNIRTAIAISISARRNMFYNS